MNDKMLIFYDGACPICSRDKDNFYQKVPNKEIFEFVDISSPDFRAESYGLVKPIFGTNEAIFDLKSIIFND